jgi:hypothetical protein
MTGSTHALSLRDAVQREMDSARSARTRGDSALAFNHLERAHILGQRLTLLHVSTHVAMLRLGWSRRDLREVVGQMPRILAAALFSRIWVPIGNTGGANVPAMRPMPIPADLRAILDGEDGGR